MSSVSDPECEPDDSTVMCRSRLIWILRTCSDGSPLERRMIVLMGSRGP